MRRPAQPNRLGPTATAWAHPYTGVAGLAVFYNDGGNPPAPAAVPTPADLAARSQPPAPAPGPQPLIDRDTGLAMTQERFSKIMTRENTKGRKALLRELAEASGIQIDVDTFDVTQFGQTLKQMETARQAQMSEEQRRTEELARREQELADKLAAAEQQAAEAARRDRDTRIRSALVRLGATGDDLDDATALMRVADDADDAAITEAAQALKARRGELFGTAPAPQTLPPAPSGAPAGGPPARTPASGKDAIRAAARQRAIDRGLRAPDAA